MRATTGSHQTIFSGNNFWPVESALLESYSATRDCSVERFHTLAELPTSYGQANTTVFDHDPWFLEITEPIDYTNPALADLVNFPPDINLPADFVDFNGAPREGPPFDMGMVELELP